jgi:hypothetical protein
MYQYQEASIQALSGFSIADVHKILLMGSNVPILLKNSIKAEDCFSAKNQTIMNFS